MPNYINKEIGGYKIEKFIAKGGMGSVYLAKHPILTQKPPVAIKVLHRHLIETGNLKQRFRELPPIAIKYMKKNLNNAELSNLDTCLDEEAIHMMICSETEDHKNAIKAFVKKRKPKFIGK